MSPHALALAAALAPSSILGPVPRTPAPPEPGPALEAPARAGDSRAWDPVLGRRLGADELDARVAGLDLVFVGEKHDDAAHHRIQAEFVGRLAALGDDVVVVFEQLDVRRQAELDAFLAGTLSEADFAAVWKQAWGFDYAIYKPIFDAMRAAGLSGVAANAPRELVTKGSRQGLDALTPEERSLLADTIAPIRTPEYDAWLREVYAGIGHGGPAGYAKFALAMQIWNETMGQHVAAALAAGKRVVFVAGTGHLIHHGGVVESVRARVPAARGLVVFPADAVPVEPGAADLFWLAD